ncbi:MAG: hypothetical protein FWB85_02405 [Chitinispirillia bacterium]|nr:hypothetical protein [Chitinispirillia bacterium]
MTENRSNKRVIVSNLDLLDADFTTQSAATEDMKFSNSDAILDTIIAKNNGRFIVSNLDLLDQF